MWLPLVIVIAILIIAAVYTDARAERWKMRQVLERHTSEIRRLRNVIDAKLDTPPGAPLRDERGRFLSKR